MTCSKLFSGTDTWLWILLIIAVGCLLFLLS